MSVAGGDMRNSAALRNPFCLRSLTGARSAEHYDLHNPLRTDADDINPTRHAAAYQVGTELFSPSLAHCQSLRKPL